MALDLHPAPGRFPIPLSLRWTAVFLEPLPGVLALGLFLDGTPVEILTEPDDVRGHLALLGVKTGSRRDCGRCRPRGRRLGLRTAPCR